MIRRCILSIRLILAVIFYCLSTPAFSSDSPAALAGARPNFLWITCEDISPYLGSYGCEQADTPNLDRLARQGVRYERAFANAPVCAVARSTLLTGMYASTIGTHHMRCDAPLPPEIPAYPKLLRQAGYYCTNNTKKDYNSPYNKDKSLWDDSTGKSHWRNRPKNKPFFAVFNITVTHESRLSPDRIAAYVKSKQIPEQPRVAPEDILLPPYHPDLPEIRLDWARLHDLITRMDALAGRRIAELSEGGVGDDTIIIFCSDHGGQLSRSKKYLYNTGTQVPLIIYFPPRWQHLAPASPGQSVDRLVSFIDFPKTLLSLAGAEIPQLMQGRIFLGPDTEPVPQRIYFFRDRLASRYDFSRAVTDGQYCYIRSFMPHRPRGRDTLYGYWVQANWGAWQRHFDAGKCDPIQSQFFQPKSTQQLFDTAADPWQIDNLAERPEQKSRLQQLSGDLDAWMIRTRDVGLIPEPLACELVGPDKSCKTIYEYANSDHYPIERLLKAAKSAGQAQQNKLPDYLELLADQHPVARYWGAYAIFLLRNSDEPTHQALEQMATEDPFAANRLMAAQVLAFCGDADRAYEVITRELLDSKYSYTFLFGINALQYSHTDRQMSPKDWQRLKEKSTSKAFLGDTTGLEYARRLIDDAIKLYPQRRRVD